MKHKAVEIWQALFGIQGYTAIKRGRGYSLKFQAKGFKDQPVSFEVPLNKFKESPKEFIRAYMRVAGWDITGYNPDKEDWQAVVNHVIGRAMPMKYKNRELINAFYDFVNSELPYSAGWVLEVWGGVVVVRFLDQPVSVIPHKRLTVEETLDRIKGVIYRTGLWLRDQVEWVGWLEKGYSLVGMLPVEGKHLWRRRIKGEEVSW